MYSSFIHIGDKLINHEREVYGLLGLIGDLGGVIEFVLLLFGVVSSFSKYIYHLKLISYLYLAK